MNLYLYSILLNHGSYFCNSQQSKYKSLQKLIPITLLGDLPQCSAAPPNTAHSFMARCPQEKFQVFADSFGIGIRASSPVTMPE
jgi:hypothetical protein